MGFVNAAKCFFKQNEAKVMFFIRWTIPCKRLPAGRVGLRAADAKSLGALTAQAAYRAVLTFQGSIWARTGRLG